MNETIVRKAILRNLADLIAIPSAYPPGDTRDISAYVAGRLKDAGYATEIVAREKTCANVVARIGRGKPQLIFNAHIDTVGEGNRADWRNDPYKATVKNERVYGLGAGNCKGSAAVQIWLAEQIAKRGGPTCGEVVFTFTGDEENLGPNGTAFLRSSGQIKPDIFVAGGQTDNQLIICERGVMWVRITTTGATAHAGSPENGDNAILRMMRLISHLNTELQLRLTERQWNGMRSTMSVGIIQGGHNTNVVPSTCSVEIDRRLLKSETVSSAYDEICEILKMAGESESTYEIDLLTGTNAYEAKESVGISAFCEAILAHNGEKARFLSPIGASDGRYFSDDEIEIISFGPGSGEEGHTANESVLISDLIDAAAIQLRVVEKIHHLAGD